MISEFFNRNIKFNSESFIKDRVSKFVDQQIQKDHEKKHARKLNQLADKIGDIQTQVMTEEPIMGWELLLSGFGQDRAYAKTIVPDKQYLLKVPTVVHQSSKKELKRNFNKGGVQQVAQTVHTELHKRKVAEVKSKKNEKR